MRRLQHLPRELLQVEILFVGGVVRADHAEAAARCLRLVELLRDRGQRLGPRHFFEFAVLAHQRRLQTLRMIVEIERVAPLMHRNSPLMPERSRLLPRMIWSLRVPSVVLQPSRAMRADGADVGHLPGPRLIAIDAAGQRADRADVDARAALVAFQVIAHVRSDLGDHAAIDHAQRADAHAFIADAHAAEAENAARRIEKHHRGKLLLRRVDLLFRVAAFARAVAEDHVLQFALAALIANRAIQRMIRQQELQRVLAGLRHLRRLGAHDHAFGDRQRACRHHLRHLLHFHQAHAAGGLQR